VTVVVFSQQQLQHNPIVVVMVLIQSCDEQTNGQNHKKCNVAAYRADSYQEEQVTTVRDVNPNFPMLFIK
jgi:hypothetical protein